MLRGFKVFGNTLLGGASSADNAAGLTFCLTNEWPDEVVQNDAASYRMVGKKGSGYVYCLGAHTLSNNDCRVAALVKSEAIESILAKKQNGSAVSDTLPLCLALLSTKETNESKEALAYMIAHDVSGHGPLSILLEDRANIEEIEINAPTSEISVYHSRYGRCQTNLRFSTEQDFRYTINRIISGTSKELNSSSPIIDAQLGDGSRLHAQLAPFAVSGAAASIRLSHSKDITLARLLESKVTSCDVLAYLWLAVESGFNMAIAGAPASGKTSLLMALGAFMPETQRVLIVEEDINELKFHKNFAHVVRLQGSSKRGEPGLKEQVINALHMRPERLIVGELRGEEAGDVFVGANLGVPFMTTIHSSGNGQQLIGRLKSKPMSVEEHTIQMLDLSVFTSRDNEGNRKLNSVVEYRWLGRGEIGTEGASHCQDGFETSAVVESGRLSDDALRSSKVLEAYAKANMISGGAALKEHKKRAKYLEHLLSSPVGDPTEVVGRYMEIV